MQIKEVDLEYMTAYYREESGRAVKVLAKMRADLADYSRSDKVNEAAVFARTNIITELLDYKKAADGLLFIADNLQEMINEAFKTGQDKGYLAGSAVRDESEPMRFMPIEDKRMESIYRAKCRWPELY